MSHSLSVDLKGKTARSRAIKIKMKNADEILFLDAHLQD